MGSNTHLMNFRFTKLPGFLSAKSFHVKDIYKNLTSSTQPHVYRETYTYKTRDPLEKLWEHTQFR